MFNQVTIYLAHIFGHHWNTLLVNTFTTEILSSKSDESVPSERSFAEHHQLSNTTTQQPCGMLSFYFQSDMARNSPDDSGQEPAKIVAEQLATSEVCKINIWYNISALSLTFWQQTTVLSYYLLDQMTCFTYSLFDSTFKLSYWWFASLTFLDVSEILCWLILLKLKSIP